MSKKYYVKDGGWGNWLVCRRDYSPDHNNPVIESFDSKSEAEDHARLLNEDYEKKLEKAAA